MNEHLIVGLMDNWYRQEAEGEARLVLQHRATIIRLKRRIMQLDRQLRLMTAQRDGERATAEIRQEMIFEIFRLFPEVHDHYTAPLFANEDEETVPDSDSDEEIGDIMGWN